MLKLKIQHIPYVIFYPSSRIHRRFQKILRWKYQLRSYTDFELTGFHANYAKPVISDIMSETVNIFGIPEHLLGFSAIYPQAAPSDVIALEKFGEQEIKSLAWFYGSSSLIFHGKKFVKPIANATSLQAQFDILKKLLP